MGGGGEDQRLGGGGGEGGGYPRAHKGTILVTSGLKKNCIQEF